MTIWLIGGTQESAELAQTIDSLHLPCIVTVTTASARSLYAFAPTLHIRVGGLNATQIQEFLKINAICCVLDASHPFATEISKLAIEAAAHYQIPYLRFERPAVEEQESGTRHQEEKVSLLPRSHSPIHFDSFPALLNTDHLTGQRVLLTIGYRNLELFQPWHDRATLFARILPSTIALEAAQKAGFAPDRLIAIRPPISVTLEQALWQQWQISMVVTKASGTAGGEDVKRQLAAELEVQLVMIDRPLLTYPQQTSNLEIALTFCQKSLNKALGVEVRGLH